MKTSYYLLSVVILILLTLSAAMYRNVTGFGIAPFKLKYETISIQDSATFQDKHMSNIKYHFKINTDVYPNGYISSNEKNSIRHLAEDYNKRIVEQIWNGPYPDFNKNHIADFIIKPSDTKLLFDTSVYRTDSVYTEISVEKITDPKIFTP